MSGDKMIRTDEISVVVQGPIYPNLTEHNLLSIRNFLPNAEIILSTWHGSNVYSLNYDKLILNDDPGGFTHKCNQLKTNNINRLIVSSRNGIAAAKNKYVLKIRSDFILKGSSFLKFFDRYDLVEPDFVIFKHKILACSYFSRNPRKVNLMFHPSDIAFFGLKDDLFNLFDIALMSKSDEFYIKKDGKWDRKYAPEQYIFITFLQKNNKNVSCSNYEPASENNIMQTERYFTSNFIFLDWKLFNLIPPAKLNNFRKLDHFSCITHIEWKRLYYKYVTLTPNKFAGMNMERLKLNSILLYYRLLKIIAKLVTLPIVGKKNKKLRKKIRNKISRI
ncbi:WavE lipopolysaccharide synthesis family protein [uncultured Gilliamella sp.]|uniref:WavE lipopolysaccharide synthesis family protein n=1 Tax=uncultured Gilliamella sp. TaxID=1193505 RepID=UPI0025DE18DB|nr:WavE lipopolysaccharide synthesis family protein [uncultured Gilliamella sp.]